MYFAWPKARLHLRKITLADIPDADGDGRRTLALIAAEPQRRKTAAGEIAAVPKGGKMLDFEVTRVRDDGYMIWFKQHPTEFLDAVGAQHRGWPYHDQILRNEDGSKEWASLFPGDTYNLVIDAFPGQAKDPAAPRKRLSLADFPDANGDGRREVRFYDCGPGDVVRAPTHVYLRRIEKGIYELRADVGLHLRLKGVAVGISADRKAWKDMPVAMREAGLAVIRLTPADLGDGVVYLRVR